MNIDFKNNGYCLIKNAINNDLANIIAQYAIFDENQNFNSDNYQVIGAHSKYADPLMETILIYILNLMEKETGLDLYPTYSFYRVYRNGDELLPHIDRPSCEISTSVCFGYSYDKEKYNWPLIVDKKEVQMQPGDMVIYRGIEIEHSRDKFNTTGNDWHVQGFFHYVDKNGPYSNFKYDKRDRIGELKNKKYISYTKDKL